MKAMKVILLWKQLETKMVCGDGCVSLTVRTVFFKHDGLNGCFDFGGRELRDLFKEVTSATSMS